MTDEVKEIETGLSILANYGAPMSGAQWDKFSNACLRSVATSRALQADLQSVRRLTIKYHGLGMKDPAQWRVGLEEIASVVAEEGAEAEPDTRDATIRVLQEENERMREALNTPEVEDFAKGVISEAQHQRERWGSDHDRGKAPLDWFWLIGYLAQKACTAHQSDDREKALHHTISTAAALANWHAAINRDSNMMVPGVPIPVEAKAEDALEDQTND